MSADNFYTIYTHPNGGYAAVMEFMSNLEDDDYTPSLPTENSKQFNTVEAAYEFAMHDSPEYGVRISPDVLAQASQQNIVS